MRKIYLDIHLVPPDPNNLQYIMLLTTAKDKKPFCFALDHKNVGLKSTISQFLSRHRPIEFNSKYSQCHIHYFQGTNLSID